MIRCLAAAEFCAVVAVAAAKTSIGLTLLYAMHNRFQRVVVCSVVALVDAVTVGLAVFLWVTIWRQDVAQICKAGGAPWRAAIFGAGEGHVAALRRPRCTLTSWLTQSSLVSVHRLRLFPRPVALHSARDEHSRVDWPGFDG